MRMPSSCQKPEPEHCERRTKRKRNQQELDFERQEDNAHGYTSLESTMPVQFTEVGDKIGVDSDMDKIIDDDPSPIIEAGLPNSFKFQMFNTLCSNPFSGDYCVSGR